MNKFTEVGIGLTGLGGVLAAFSFFVLGSIPLSALGFALLILGLVIFIFPQYLVPHQVVKGMLLGAVSNIEAVLEEFGATHKAIYLPPREGKMLAYVPLSGNPAFSEIEKMTEGPKRILVRVDGHPGLFIYPPGAEVVALSGVVDAEMDGGTGGEAVIENGIGYCLVDFSELASRVQVSLEGDRVFLRLRNVKVQVEAPRFIKVMGSLPSSLAACVIAAVARKPVRVLEEKKEGRWFKAVFEVKK